MPERQFRDRIIGIADFDEVSSGEHVIEFHDPTIAETGSHVAFVIPGDADWKDATVSINPHLSKTSADLVAWAIQTAPVLITTARSERVGPYDADLNHVKE
jgi:hypothetical protein